MTQGRHSNHWAIRAGRRAALAGALAALASAATAMTPAERTMATVDICRSPDIAVGGMQKAAAARGWTPAGGQAARTAARHVAAGIHHAYGDRGNWRARYREAARVLPTLQGMKSKANARGGKTTTYVGLFVAAGPVPGYLAVQENLIQDQGGRALLHGRECWIVVPDDAAIAGLKAMGRNTATGDLRLPNGSVRGRLGAYGVSGRMRGLPASGLDFTPDATQYLMIRMVHDR